MKIHANECNLHHSNEQMPLIVNSNFITYNFNFFQLHNIFRFTLQQELALQNYRNTSETETHFLGGIDRTIYFAIENRKDFLKNSCAPPNR